MMNFSLLKELFCNLFKIQIMNKRKIMQKQFSKFEFEIL